MPPKAAGEAEMSKAVPSGVNLAFEIKVVSQSSVSTFAVATSMRTRVLRSKGAFVGSKRLKESKRLRPSLEISLSHTLCSPKVRRVMACVLKSYL